MFWDLHDVQRILPFISSQVFRFLERETCDGFIIIVVVVVVVVVIIVVVVALFVVLVVVVAVVVVIVVVIASSFENRLFEAPCFFASADRYLRWIC